MAVGRERAGADVAGMTSPTTSAHVPATPAHSRLRLSPLTVCQSPLPSEDNVSPTIRKSILAQHGIRDSDVARGAAASPTHERLALMSPVEAAIAEAFGAIFEATASEQRQREQQQQQRQQQPPQPPEQHDEDADLAEEPSPTLRLRRSILEMYGMEEAEPSPHGVPPASGPATMLEVAISETFERFAV